MRKPVDSQLKSYPKRHGKRCNHWGCDLFTRTLKAIQREEDRRSPDEDKILRVLALLPRLYDRCRRNAGY